MEREHKIGEGSVYDADMTLIESFVRHRKDPDNIINTTAVYTYYYSQLLNYWENFKINILPKKEKKLFVFGKNYEQRTAKFVNDERTRRREKLYGELNYYITLDKKKIFTNDEEYFQHYYPLPASNNFIHKGMFKQVPLEEEFLSKAETVYYGKELQFIRQYFNIYEDRFFALLEVMNKNFHDQGYLDSVMIFRMFMYIGALTCGYPNVDFINVNRKPSSGYPLPNNTGLFGLNTFMYAHYSKVKLVGIPTDDTSYDGITGCPVAFMDHDFTHNSHTRSVKKNEAEVYYKIFETSYNKSMKELLILVLWICVHEEYISILSIKEREYFSQLKFSTLAYRQEFASEFLSFASMLEDATPKILAAFPELSKVRKEKYYFMLVMLYGFLELRELRVRS